MKNYLSVIAVWVFSFALSATLENTGDFDHKIFAAFNAFVGQTQEIGNYSGQKCVFTSLFSTECRFDGVEEVKNYRLTILGIREAKRYGNTYFVTYDVRENYFHYWLKENGSLEKNGDEEITTGLKLWVTLDVVDGKFKVRKVYESIASSLTGWVKFGLEKETLPILTTRFVHQNFCGLKT